ncbi:dTDP-4-dehydrorhamnose reductase [Tenacibaculum sp. ZS6-P6]|uniref:dTDP-4-dehydrorhamnose reductase n=1 Tax=Tenacibaculum sp. ZS6-P6 TaxID=3447503 RepID=UPI003F95FEFF
MRSSENKILVTGSNGQLGSELRDLEKEFNNFEFVFVNRSLMPLNDSYSVLKVLSKEKPNYIINAAAYTAVDKAEDEKEIAFLINDKAVDTISKWCALNKSRLIHISTDYVFDGTSSLPVKEDDITNPINTYGASKLAGEKKVIQNCNEYMIFRTSWVYSRYGNNFVKTMCKLMESRDEISVVSDQIGSSTYAKDLAEIILQIIAFKKWKSGIYNYSNEGQISWYDFAVEIQKIMKFDCKVNKILTKDFPAKAKRPSFSLLNKNKIKETFDIEIPNWGDSLRKMLNKNI